MDKVICIENTFKTRFNSFKVGELMGIEPMTSSLPRKSGLLNHNVEDTLFNIVNTCDYVVVYKNHNYYEYEFDDEIIRFEKYTFRKEKLERILNDE